MKIVTIIGARPQFIKAATVSRAIADHNRKSESGNEIKEVIIHTGQHFDENMSRIFFEELQIPEPDYHLGINSLFHGAMTGRMLELIEERLKDEMPDTVLIYGDTNSTMAGALAAVKLHIPVAHVEAGLRSFNRRMPEEINRVVSDQVSNLLFCPTKTAVKNLAAEGITKGVFNVGDVMFDAFLFYRNIAAERSALLSDLGLEKSGYCLVTVHRQENTENRQRLTTLFNTFEELAGDSCPFIIPLHPRTRKILDAVGYRPQTDSQVKIISPISYLDMVALESFAKVILTDSGGVQKEAYFAGVPCITLREETEWIETVGSGWNRVAGTEPLKIKAAFTSVKRPQKDRNDMLFGRGNAAEQIVAIL